MKEKDNTTLSNKMVQANQDRRLKNQPDRWYYRVVNTHKEITCKDHVMTATSAPTLMIIVSHYLQKEYINNKP